MPRFARLAVATIAVMALAACSSGAAATGTPGAAATGTPGTAAAAACAPSTATGTVTAGIKDFAFDPTAVSAKVGDVITWTNNGAASHTVTVDNQSGCDSTVAAGATTSLTFSAAGSYPFHCKIHSQMTGTITITG